VSGAPLRIEGPGSRDQRAAAPNRPPRNLRLRVARVIGTACPAEATSTFRASDRVEDGGRGSASTARRGAAWVTLELVGNRSVAEFVERGMASTIPKRDEDEVAKMPWIRRSLIRKHGGRHTGEASVIRPGECPGDPGTGPDPVVLRA